MAIQQVISNFPPAPNSATDTPIDFNAKADAFVNHQSGVYTPEVNTWADQANTTASEVNTNATSAEDSANEATIQADRAEANAGTTFPNPVFPQEEGYILTARELEGNIWEENSTIGDVGSAVDNIFTGVNTFNGETVFGGVVDFDNIPRFNTYPRTDGISTLDGATTHDIANMGIEYGSNANGTFTKFPDGTMICLKVLDSNAYDINNSWGEMFISSSFSGGEMPAIFTTVPSIQFSWQGATIASVMFIESDGKTASNFGNFALARGTSSIGVDGAVSIVAIGRWK